MSEPMRAKKDFRLSGAKTVFLAMIAEIDLTVLNLANIFFVARFLGADGAAAYEVTMPCIMAVSALIALGYNGVQAVCAKDYGAGDFAAFERHKNAAYTWMAVVVAAFTLLLALFKAPVLDLLGANDGKRGFAHRILRHWLRVLYPQFRAGLLLQDRGRVYPGPCPLPGGGAAVPAGL